MQLVGMIHQDNGLSVVLSVDSYIANLKVVIRWLQEESYRKASVQQLDSEKQVVVFEEQDHYGVKVSLY